MKRGTLRTAGVVMIAVIASMLAKCISATEKDIVIYDAAKDEFRMLMVLEDIKVSDANDLAFLEGIYKNRDHLIAPVIPGGAAMFPLFAVSVIRLGDNEAAPINVFGSPPDSLENTKTTASLNTVKITPGTFFLENGKLGYYQAVTVPGKTIDTVLADLSSKMPMENVVNGIDGELARREGGGAVHTWEELKAYTLKKIVIKPKPAQGEAVPAGEPDINPLEVLDAESLKKIKKAATDKTLKLVRQKQTIVTALPLIEKDAKAAADLISAATKRVDAALAEAKETPETAEQIKMAKSWQAALKALTVNADATGITASVDIVKFAESAAALPVSRVDMNGSMRMDGEAAPARPEGPDVVAYVREKKLALDEKLTAAQVVKDFQAGTLKGYASEAPVKAGEGLTKPKGANDGPPAMP
jgi:hypothetical protein